MVSDQAVVLPKWFSNRGTKMTAWSLIYFLNYSIMIFSPGAYFGNHPTDFYIWTNIGNSDHSVFLEPKWSRARQSSHSNNNGKYPQTDRPYLASPLLVWRGGKKPKMVQSCTVNHTVVWMAYRIYRQMLCFLFVPAFEYKI